MEFVQYSLPRINERFSAKLRCIASIPPPLQSLCAGQGCDQVETDGQVDDPPQYPFSGGAFEKPVSTRSQLESRIVKLWKKVWLGLYQIDDDEDRYHVERLEALSLGAGLTRTYRVGELQVLRRHFLRSETNNAVASLKLFQGLSLSTLLSVVHILEAYESEIDNMRLLYIILRSGQLALHETADLAQTAVVRAEYMEIAEPMEKRIRQYDIRMNVVNMDICDEAMGFYRRQKGEYVYYKAFPNAW
ncbi:hypothetical protein Pdw03_6390 [Penicillium digitatum]|uniref:Uncharacterized protein n=3 Tax=Penicillium digitatum TaxID=36651 RepID=K9G9H4_PEND2|nr:hypothetical protein PDIP_37070 [Penicillium digitatum Pd1]EKV16374.1 hypothetical protein PDIP_37070 [Penicillium digitatum Pd1]EKV18590.1 hypothetical protein PDIG_09040 [Penicillium digitatum PHI26]KAG0158230.1 hypothetical protein PDIDSM_5743 [Penicillium digitatum]QQK42489.1 hypothetical protein Pdw03_6390 [Penicillium digitatum]